MTIVLAPEEIELLRQLVRPRVRALTDLLEAQIADCPPGCDDWLQTTEQLAVARRTLQKVEVRR